NLEVCDSFRKLARSRLHLLEQARVFNGDHGLVGEGIDELDLAFGEWAHFGAPNEDHPNCVACVDQGHGERSANTAQLKRSFPALGIFIPFGQHVRDLYRSPVDDSTRSNGSALKRQRVFPDRSRERNFPMMGDKSQKIAIYLEDGGVVSI